MVKVVTSNVCGAFGASPVGSKVEDAARFLDALEEEVGGRDFSKALVPGQGFVPLPAALPHVSSGEGLRTADPADYVAREHRGEVELFLRRERAEPATFLACVVYTAAAYLADPDVLGEPGEAARVRGSGATHVLVAVIASAAPEAPLTYRRFTENLAGGNREALAWTADEVRAEAAKVAAHWRRWCVVAG